MVLSTRAANLREVMDRADCDPDQLARTYRYFAIVNTAVSGWSVLYRRFVRPTLSESADHTESRVVRILDIGCGGGDVLRRVVRRARRDGFSVEGVGIDPDERAIYYARQARNNAGLEFRVAHAAFVAVSGEQFDIVISNHVLHHLPNNEVTDLCHVSERLATRLVLHNDIHRHPLAYASFPLVGGLFPNSFILPDGMRSIRRSFTPRELEELAPAGWEVRRALPFRCVLMRQL